MGDSGIIPEDYRAMIDLVTRQGPHARPGSLVTLTPAVREAIDMWHRLLLTLNARSACTVISRPRVPGEATSDASFSGWGWEGMGQYGYGQWPAEWRDRIGQLLRPPRRQPRPGSSAPGLAMGTILGTGSGLGQDWVRTGHTRARTGHTCRFSVPARARPDVPGTVRAACSAAHWPARALHHSADQHARLAEEPHGISARPCSSRSSSRGLREAQGSLR